MGCCKSKGKGRTVASRSASLYSKHPHIMFLGLPGVGKTTLLYRTLFPGWRDENCVLEPTEALHHELYVNQGMTLSLWDLSGNDALQRSWVSLYRYVKMWAAVYMVSLVESDPERIFRSRTGIRSLLAEDCLCDSAIVIIMNRFGVALEALSVSPVEMASRLGLTDVAEQGEAAAGDLASGPPFPTQAASLQGRKGAAAAAAKGAGSSSSSAPRSPSGGNSAAAAAGTGAGSPPAAQHSIDAPLLSREPACRGIVSDRVRWYVVDAKDALADPQWREALQFMRTHFIKMLAR